MLAVERTNNVGTLDSNNPLLFFSGYKYKNFFLLSASVDLLVSLEVGRRMI